MKFKINKTNHHLLFPALNLAVRNKIKKFEISLNYQTETLPFSFLRDIIYQSLNYEKYFEVWLINFPYCILNRNSRDHVLIKKGYQGEKNDKCRKCLYNEICSGFPKGYFKKFGVSEVKPIADLPLEAMIEVESKCNFFCKFCYNRVSFSKYGRNTGNLSSENIKKIIDHINNIGVKIIRFTGGEPLMRNDIFRLMKYAKNRGLQVRLNTNCSLVNKNNITKMAKVVDNVLIPIESWENAIEEKITGYRNSLNQKIKAIKLFNKIKTPIIRIGTVATRENILNFQKLADLILALPINEWEFYRPISVSKASNNISSDDLRVLVEDIIRAQKKTKIYISIANAVPFCAIQEPNKLNYISSGALYDDGHNRLVVDPRGFVKPHYFFEKNIGDPLNILDAWNNNFMKKMRNLKYLPEKCWNCRFKFKCRGGSRHEAKISNGSIKALDPLSNPKNIN